jgi:hypothetical protein
MAQALPVERFNFDSRKPSENSNGTDRIPDIVDWNIKRANFESCVERHYDADTAQAIPVEQFGFGSVRSFSEFNGANSIPATMAQIIK